MKRHSVSLAAAREIAFNAMIIGSTEANYAGDCQQPRIIELRGEGPLLLKRLAALKDDPFLDWVDGQFLPRQGLWHTDLKPLIHPTALKVRCRKCRTCLAARARLWTARAFTEVGQARRTWFGTLTIGPERRFWAKASALSHVLRTRNENFDMLTATERFRAIERETSPEVTRWLKRVRKVSGAPLRYFLASEAHKDGFPHYHCLVHEADIAVTKATLQTAWKWGFSQFKLVDPAQGGAAAWYVAKYLSKDAQTRVRASRRYGQLCTKLRTDGEADANEYEEKPASRVNGVREETKPRKARL